MTNRSAWLDAHEETAVPFYLRPLAWLMFLVAMMIEGLERIPPESFWDHP